MRWVVEEALWLNKHLDLCLATSAKVPIPAQRKECVEEMLLTVIEMEQNVFRSEA